MVRDFYIRLVSVQSGSEVTLHEVKYLCNSHLFLSWRPWSVWRLFVALFGLCRVWGSETRVVSSLSDSQWPVFVVSRYLPELFGVVVLEIKPLAFLAVRSLSRNWGFGSRQIWFRSLEADMPTVCCWACHSSPGISVCMIINTVGPVSILEGTCVC